MPFVKKVEGPNYTHTCHCLQSKVHVDIEEPHVSNKMEIKAFHDENTWDANHWSSTKEQEMIEHN
jgi:hypothetical protein